MASENRWPLVTPVSTDAYGGRIWQYVCVMPSVFGNRVEPFRVLFYYAMDLPSLPDAVPAIYPGVSVALRCPRNLAVAAGDADSISCLIGCLERTRNLSCLGYRLHGSGYSWRDGKLWEVPAHCGLHVLDYLPYFLTHHRCQPCH